MTQKPILDPHLHLFDLSQGDYCWLKPDNPPFWPDKAKINRSFFETELTAAQPDLAGFVHIEAGFDNERPWREIAFLQQHCRLPFKSVAFLDISLKESTFVEQLKQLLAYPSVAGCRHILDQEAVAILKQPQAEVNLAHLAKAGLSFDLQMPLGDSEAVARLAEILVKLPNLTVIINHAGWPPYQEQAANINEDSHWLAWQQGLKRLSEFPRVAIKCSGWEMAERHYQTAWVSQVILACLKSFGEKRVMLASNFPLCLFTVPYETLWQNYRTLPLSDSQLSHLLYENTRTWYGLT